MTKYSSSGTSKSRASNAQERLGLNERLGLIALIDEGMRFGSSGSPIVADLFNELWGLVDKTVSGARIDRLKPEDSHNGFRVLTVTVMGRGQMEKLRVILQVAHGGIHRDLNVPQGRGGFQGG